MRSLRTVPLSSLFALGFRRSQHGQAATRSVQLRASAETVADQDHDGVPDSIDNCPDDSQRRSERLPITTDRDLWIFPGPIAMTTTMGFGNATDTCPD